MPKTVTRQFVTSEHNIAGAIHAFNFKRDTAQEATAKLAELIGDGTTADVEKIREALKGYIYEPPAKKNGSTTKPAAKKPISTAKETKQTGSADTNTGKRPRGDANPKRVRALEIFTEETKAGTSQEDMLKKAQSELKITYANAYYYYDRVFNAKKKK